MPPDDDLNDRVRTALLALEGTVIEDLHLPLPADLKDISKAAAMVSGVVEDRIPTLLNGVRDRTWDEDGAYHEFEFRRFTIGFPDILLVERANEDNIAFRIEAKSWYALSGDNLTARFETSPVVIEPGTLIVVVAWLLDGVVSGSPKLLRVYSDDALRLATVRDAAWEAIGEDHRVVHPENDETTLRSLWATVARGETRKNGRWVKDADNFGKLHRLYDPEILAFEGSVMGLRAAGKTLRDWQGFIRA